jgi:hypothetical protein
MAGPRTARARETERLVAEWYQEHGWTNAERIPASLPGRDITGMPGYAPEVKARANFDPMAWVKQAARNAGADMPFVIMRCNGQGPESVGEWLVIRRLKDDTEMLRAFEDYYRPEDYATENAHEPGFLRLPESREKVSITHR